MGMNKVYYYKYILTLFKEGVKMYFEYLLIVLYSSTPYYGYKHVVEKT